MRNITVVDRSWTLDESHDNGRQATSIEPTDRQLRGGGLYTFGPQVDGSTYPRLEGGGLYTFG